MPHTEHSNATALHVESTGSGPDLALVHGFTQTGHSWRHIVAELKNDYAVHCVDLPGHGDSGDIVTTGLGDAATKVVNAVGPANYVGYSLGGRVCLRLALDYPNAVRSLVLIGATPGIASDLERLTRRQSDGELADSLTGHSGSAPSGLATFLTTWVSQPMFADMSSEQHDLDTRRRNTPEGLAMTLRTLGTGTQEPLFSRLHELSMPTLILAGSDDAKFVAIGKDMEVAIGSNAHFMPIHGARHAAPFSQPERFVDLVREFLATTTN